MPDLSDSKPRIMRTISPDKRPPYKEWVKQMRITELAWAHSPDGRERALRIMEPVGNVEHFLTPFERITGIHWH